MKVRLTVRPGDDVRGMWLLALLILGFGFYLILNHYEREIAQAHALAESFYRRTVANDRIVQEAAALARVQSAAQADLQRVSRATSLSASTAGLVSTIDRSAAAFHTQIVSLEPAPASPSHGKARLADDALLLSTLTIRVRGRFRDLLGFIEDLSDLSHHRELLRISDTQLGIASGQRDAHEPKLDAAIHAELYRIHLSYQ